MTRSQSETPTGDPPNKTPGAETDRGLPTADSPVDSRDTALRLRGLGQALRFLFPPGYRDDQVSPEVIGRSITWFVPLGLLVGLLWVGTFRFTWKLYGETGNIRVVPAMVVVMLECLITGPFLAMGLARAVHLLTGSGLRREAMDRLTPLSPVGTLTLVLVVLSQYILILSIPADLAWWPASTDWRSNFNFMYPQPIYRPLILAPIWGRWAILIAATIGRPGPHADPAVVKMCGRLTPGRLLLHGLPVFALTAIYCSRARNFLIGIILGMIIFGVAYLNAVVMARRGRGQTRQSLFATGLIAQLAFLALYRAFWSLIHR